MKTRGLDRVIRRCRLHLIATVAVMLLVTPVHLPAPMSLRDMGVDPNASEQEQARQVAEFGRTHAQGRQDVLAEQSAQIAAIQQARVPSAPTVQTSTATPVPAAAVTAPAPGGRSTLHLLVMALAAVAGWVILKWRRRAVEAG